MSEILELEQVGLFLFLELSPKDFVIVFLLFKIHLTLLTNLLFVSLLFRIMLLGLESRQVIYDNNTAFQTAIMNILFEMSSQVSFQLLKHYYFSLYTELCKNGFECTANI